MKLKNIYKIAQEQIFKLLKELDLEDALISKINSKMYFPIVLTSIDYKEINFFSIFKEILGKEVNTLCIVPCSFYIDSMLPYLKKQFKNIILVDNFRTGYIHEIPIIKENEVSPEKIDVFYISCLTNRLIDHFQKKFAGYPQITLTSLFKTLIEKYDINLTINHDLVDYLSEKNTERDLFFIGGFFLEQLSPTVKELKKRGFNIKILLEDKFSPRHGLKVQLENIIEDIPTYYVNLVDVFYLLKRLKKGKAIFISNLNFSGHTVESNIILSMIKSISNIPCGSLMLDVIWPPFKGLTSGIVYEIPDNLKLKIDDNKFFEMAYKNTISEMDFVILNANTKDVNDFLVNTTKQINIFSFYRYSYYNNDLKFYKEKNNEIHIAVINSIFSTHNRDQMREYLGIEVLKSILDQEVHVHKFSSEEDIKTIYDNLSFNQRKFFHGEEVIFDQYKLLEKLSHYDCGWMVHDTVALAHPIYESSSQFLKELYYLFGLTTVPTTVITFCAAGIPVLVNRSMKGLMEQFPKEFFIPLETSEICSLKKILQKELSLKRKKFCFQNRHLFSIEHNIEQLINFLEKFD